ncbi:hypothetical protein L9F63_010772, partial [Diploptera punctata]
CIETWKIEVAMTLEDRHGTARVRCTSCDRSLNYATKMARMIQSSTCEDRKVTHNIFFKKSLIVKKGKKSQMNLHLLPTFRHSHQLSQHIFPINVHHLETLLRWTTRMSSR